MAENQEPLKPLRHKGGFQPQSREEPPTLPPPKPGDSVSAQPVWAQGEITPEEARCLLVALAWGSPRGGHAPLDSGRAKLERRANG